MVLAAIILLVVVGAGLFAFRGSITAAANKAFKSEAERKFELEQQQEEAVKKKTADEKFIDRGVFGSVDVFFRGEEQIKLEQELARQKAVEAAEAQIEQQAKDAGFASVADFNKATDSGAVVIGGKRNVVDFGRIGDVSEAVKASQQTRRFGGQR